MNNNNHVMLDLETMGNGSNSAIIAIGAVAFDFKNGVYDKFYQNIHLETCLSAGMKVDGSTIEWWLTQSEQARDSLLKNRVSIQSALSSFARWYESSGAEEVWGNGSMFDNTILGNAYKSCGMSIPWKFWNDRCYRTIKSMSKVELKRVGTHHNAVDDAESQALHLIEILRSNK